MFVLQMLFLATFFPTWEGGAGVYDFVGVSVVTSASFRKISHTLSDLLLLLPAYNVCVCLPGVYEGHSGPGRLVGSPSRDVS